MTVGEWLNEWITRKETSGRKITTTSDYRSIIDNHLNPLIGKHRIGNLTPDHVQKMIDRLASDPGLRRKNGTSTPMGPTRIRNIRAVLRAALNDAMKRGLVSRNVAVLVDLPQVKRPAPVRIPEDRLTMFLDHAAGTDFEALWLADVLYGVRRGELLGARWDGIDTDRKLIFIRSTVLEIKGEHRCPHCGGTHSRILFDTVKTTSGERVLPLVPEVEAALMVHRLRQDAERAAYGADYSDHGLVFAAPDGTPWRPSRVSSEFKRLMVSSGAAEGMTRIPSLKALRSTMVTALHEEGVALEVVSRVAGHAGTTVTDDYYLSVNAERVRSEFSVIASRLTAGRRSDRHSDQQRKTAVFDPDQPKGGGAEK